MNAEDRCEATNGGRRCVKRKHDLGCHVALIPEGEPAARIELWGEPATSEFSPVDLYTRRPPTVAVDLAASLSEAQVAAIKARYEEVMRQISGVVPPQWAPAPQSQPTGELCDTCGSFAMVRTGACMTCQSCGSSSGCG